MRLSLIAAVITALLLGPSDRLVAQSTSCLGADAEGVEHHAFVTGIVNEGDSSRLAAQGMPFRPAGGVTFVADTVVCNQAIAALSSGLPAGDPRRSVPAYVMAVGSTTYAVVRPRTSPDTGSVYTFFDSSFARLADIVEMR